MRETGNGEFPADVFRRFRVPLHWLSGTFDHARRAWSTKLRPVLCRDGGDDNGDKKKRECKSFHFEFLLRFLHGRKKAQKTQNVLMKSFVLLVLLCGMCFGGTGLLNAL
jgi:hypothetical protein